MARNGSGSYSLPALNPVVTGTSVSSTWANNTMNDIASALTQSVSNDGQTPITANLPMTGFKHTNVANATARTEYCAAGQAQDNTFDWLTSVAGTDTITASAAIGMSAYAAGQCFRFVAAGANTTTSVTLNLNSLGAKSITKNGSTALAVGDIPSGCVVEVVYDGTRFQLVGVSVNHASSSDTATNATNVTGTIGSSVTATTQTLGDNSTKVSTTAFLVAAMSQASLTANGYQKLPNGLIIQWGSVNTAASVPGASVTFPIAFGTAVLFVGAFSVGGNNTANAYSATTTGMSVTTYQGNTGSAVALTGVPWLAIGY